MASSTSTITDNGGTVHAAYVVNDGGGVASYVVSVCDYMATLRGPRPLALTGYALNEMRAETVDCMACISDNGFWRNLR